MDGIIEGGGRRERRARRKRRGLCLRQAMRARRRADIRTREWTVPAAEAVLFLIGPPNNHYTTARPRFDYNRGHDRTVARFSSARRPASSPGSSASAAASSSSRRSSSSPASPWSRRRGRRSRPSSSRSGSWESSPITRAKIIDLRASAFIAAGPADVGRRRGLAGQYAAGRPHAEVLRGVLPLRRLELHRPGPSRPKVARAGGRGHAGAGGGSAAFSARRSSGSASWPG